MKIVTMSVDDMYLENLEEFVIDENKVVTYKWLSKTLSVHVNEAKRMLHTFADHQRNTKDRDLSLTYFVSGIKEVDGLKTHQFLVVNEENLDSTKASLSPVTSCHVYSVQKAKLKDSGALYTTDYTNSKISLVALASAIKNDQAIKVQSSAEDDRPDSRPPVKQEPPEQSKHSTSSITAKSNKKPNAIANMFSKAPVNKTKSEDKPEESGDAKVKTNKSKSQKGGVMSFFNKQTSGKTTKPTEEEGEKPQVKKQSPNKGKAPVRGAKKNKKPASDVEDDDDVIAKSKKRRRIQEDIWNSSSEEEMAEPEPPRVPSPEPSENEPSEDEEPIPPTPPKSPVKSSQNGKEDNSQKTSRRVHRRKQVDKTFMDEEGYMVTEKVWESESASEADEPVKPVETKKSTPPHEKKAKAAVKAGTKQSSLMSFFKKKN